MSDFLQSLGNIVSGPSFANAMAAIGQAGQPGVVRQPLGPALANALGGWQQGINQNIQRQEAQQDLLTKQLNNQVLQASVPARMQLLGALGGGSGGGFPFGAPSAGMASGAGNSAPAASGPNYLTSPQQIAMMGRVAMATNQDRAAASLFSLLGSQAGGPGYAFAPNGTAFAVPGGGADPYGPKTQQHAAESGIDTQAAQQRAQNKSSIDLNQSYDTPQQFKGPNGETLLMTPRQAMSGGGAAGNLPVTALSSIADPNVRSMAVNAALRAGLPPTAWPSWISAVHNESGWNMNAADGTHGEIGPGQVMPATAAGMGYSPQQLRDPQTNLIASAQYFGQKWQEAQGNAIGALRGYNTGSVNGGPTPYTDQATQRTAGWSGVARPAPGVTMQPMSGGGMAITSSRNIQDADIANDRKAADEAAEEIQHAQTGQARLLQMRDVASSIPTGSNAQSRTAIANWLQTYSPALANNQTINRLFSLPDAARAQEFAKLSLTSAGEQERSVLGGRGGFRAIELYQRANPSLDLQPDANRRIINMQMIAQQADIDYAQAEQGFYNQSKDAYTAGRSDYQALSKFDQQWQSQRNPQVYAAAMDALNGSPFEKWSRGLSKDEGLRAMQVIGRVDPNAQVMGGKGRMFSISQFLPQGQGAN